MINVSILGATGYTGGELIRTLLRHPEVRVTHITSETCPGQPIDSIHQDLAGRTDLVLEKRDISAIARDSDLAFLCLPHGKSAKAGKQLLDKGLKVVDLSADFRLKTESRFQKTYGIRHPHPKLLKQAVYGIPEIHRKKIAASSLVANPGCYSTAAILAAHPLFKKGLAKAGSLIVDAKSGVSGAGRKVDPRYIFCETNENFFAYAVGRHRHAPEIEQELKTTVTFVPHLLPINRGILATVYVDLKKPVSGTALRKIYTEAYAGEPFILVLPEGSFPEIKSVQHSNFCHIGVRSGSQGRRAIIVAAIDNLGKGASSQAVQNMNLMCGLDERMGLL